MEHSLLGTGPLLQPIGDPKPSFPLQHHPPHRSPAFRVLVWGDLAARLALHPAPPGSKHPGALCVDAGDHGTRTGVGKRNRMHRRGK